jgi:hypothetical protein
LAATAVANTDLAPWKTTKAELSGWAGIEDHLLKHGIGWVQGCANDIDTLLVFVSLILLYITFKLLMHYAKAGLFSAVLSAFVVETYSMLSPSPDPGTTDKLLASGFTAMLSHESPASFNNTVTSLLASSSSSPTTAARWINALFFVSLVLSLAAALFGILAKQWLREYMQWNSSLALPRENVLVRQMRIEAWEAWNVAATIAAIPALLELAMVQFLVGIVILLWTLDDIVALVVTVTVVLFLGVFSTFTVLPIFTKRCPYKSPTAWALVMAFQYMSYPIRAIPAWYPVLRARWENNTSEGLSVLSKVRKLFSSEWAENRKDGVNVPRRVWYVGPKTWRERDLGTCAAMKIRRPGWWPRYEDARAAARRELDLERRHLSASGVLLEDAEPTDWPNWYMDRLLWNISETALLVRALSWVERASEDTRVQEYIPQSLSSIHKDMSGLPASDISSFQAVTLLRLISSLRRDDFSNPHMAFRGLDSEHDPQALNTITALRKEIGVTFDEAQGIRFRDAGRSSLVWGISPYNNILRRMLPTVVESSITESHWVNDSRMVSRICEWISLWNDSWYPGQFTITNCHLSTLRSILHSHKSDRKLAPDLRYVALRFALEQAKVSMDVDDKKFGKISIFT